MTGSPAPAPARGRREGGGTPGALSCQMSRVSRGDPPRRPRRPPGSRRPYIGAHDSPTYRTPGPPSRISPPSPPLARGDLGRKTHPPGAQGYLTTPHPRPNLGGETAGSSDPGTQEKGPAAVRDLLTVAPLAVALLVAAILAPYIGALAAVVGVGQ